MKQDFVFKLSHGYCEVFADLLGNGQISRVGTYHSKKEAIQQLLVEFSKVPNPEDVESMSIDVHFYSTIN